MSQESEDPVVVLLNGPLGIGKSSLAEALGEMMDRSVTLDGDRLAAVNPPPPDPVAYLHTTFALLVERHLAAGYVRFVIPHFWAHTAEIDDLEGKLREVAPRLRIRCYRLTLPHAENLRRIAQRQRARIIDETEFETRTFEEEYRLLSSAAGTSLGIPLDATDPPEVMAARLLQQWAAS